MSTGAQSLLGSVTPAQLGLPDKFRVWRPRQTDSIAQMVDSDVPYQAQSVPTGGGKSVSYIAAALLTGRRTCVLTVNKGLQNQLSRDFGPIGLVDIRGRANYSCRMSEGMTCDDGMHLKCREAACPYKQARQAALASTLVVTNYPYWMLVNDARQGDGIGSFDMLVCDEAHAAPDEVAGLMSVEFTTREVHGYMMKQFLSDGSPLDSWRLWARSHLPLAKEKREQLEGMGWLSARELSNLRAWTVIERKLETLAWSQGDWEYEPTASGFRFEPLWAAQYAAEKLFRGVRHVVLMSATLTSKTLDLLGIPESRRQLLEYPYIFPVNRCPVIWLPTARVDHRMTPSARSYWLSRFDQIIRGRLDRKGIIHSVSYRRAQEIAEQSEYRDWMIVHNSENTAEKVAAYLSMPPPSILVSPALSTGYDFPDDDCEYQIIAKMPFPDSRGRIISARSRSDPDYAPYLLCQELVQACGRGMRHERDRCENIIIDNHFAWVRGRYHAFFPRWFSQLYRRSDTIPEPPPKL